MRIWTDAARQKQRDAIKRWAPWKASTGPRTEKGKRISAQNAYKHGAYRREMVEFRIWLADVARGLKRLKAFEEYCSRLNYHKKCAECQGRKNFSQNELFSADRFFSFRPTLYADLMRQYYAKSRGKGINEAVFP